ncbi:hypothetical protein DEU56DRAFT_810285 [Suillus clintonianus]|uniref:uncharacterized protein n=1 Tax=Suillus clintonianus TaxID=1904413 RepID=UPI001B86B350|nr:uncharacterized protein DEU56DRAFT_810285 [Suillus clintonianus]KAG2133707.1 hypothetical protein DEU56DRAFT_810285 [Suillus clintonianus]
MSSSSGLYIPVHRRVPSTGSPSSSVTSSPAHSSCSLSPVPHDSLPIYTPSDLLLLASSPLSKLSHEELSALRAIAPEIVQSRRQRKSHDWHTRRSQLPSRSYPNSSESEGEELGWRK